jgi:hypothetical protein
VPRKTGKSRFSLSEIDLIEMSTDALTKILASKPLFPFLQSISIPIHDLKHPTWSMPFSLTVSAQAPEPVEEIITAETGGRLRVVPVVVLMRQHGPQTVLVMFVDDRPVGHIIPGPVRLSLQLDICAVTVLQRVDTLYSNALTGDQGGATQPDEIKSIHNG